MKESKETLKTKESKETLKTINTVLGIIASILTILVFLVPSGVVKLPPEKPTPPKPSPPEKPTPPKPSPPEKPTPPKPSPPEKPDGRISTPPTRRPGRTPTFSELQEALLKLSDTSRSWVAISGSGEISPPCNGQLPTRPTTPAAYAAFVPAGGVFNPILSSIIFGFADGNARKAMREFQRAATSCTAYIYTTPNGIRYQATLQVDSLVDGENLALTYTYWDPNSDFTYQEIERAVVVGNALGFVNFSRAPKLLSSDPLWGDRINLVARRLADIPA